jgi:outer membrane protein assembly factor BamA
MSWHAEFGRQGLVAGCVGLFTLLSVTSAAAQARAVEVWKVDFVGNETFPDDSLRRAIVTQQTECRSTVFIPFCALGLEFALRRGLFRERELPRDQARLTVWYFTRGFRDVQVDTPTVVRRPDQVDVTFVIQEGRPVLASTIVFEGGEELIAGGILDALPLRQGDRLNTLARDATKDTIAQRLRNDGYAHADVFYHVLYPEEDPYNAQVTFQIVPGPRARYGAIDIQGLEELGQGTVLRTLQFNSGDLYRDTDIEQARARLFGLDIIRSAQIIPDLESFPDSIVPVRVLITEGDAYRVRAGGGWSTSECLNLEARWASRNFFGGGRLLQVRGRLGNILAPQAGDPLCNQSGTGRYAHLTGLASVDLSQPWIFSTDNSLTTSIFAERQTLPDIFVRRAIGFQAALTRRIDPRTLATLYYRPELSELDADDVLFCSGFLVCSPEHINLLKGANWLAPVGLSVTRDRSNDLLNPRRGYRLSLDVEYAARWTGSNFRYVRTSAEATWYDELVGPVVLATRIRSGWVGSGDFRSEQLPIIHPQRRFFAGGANSVRGFAQSRLGPRVLFTEPVELLTDPPGGPGCDPEELVDLSCDAGVAIDSVSVTALPIGGTRVLEGNAEVRFPLASWLEGVAFTDFGQAWSSTINLRDIEVTPGFGLRFPSPVGPIRIDLAYRGRRAQDLAVITPQIVAATGMDADSLVVNGETIPYVQTNQLEQLTPFVLFTERGSRFQLHVSIGQAF